MEVLLTTKQLDLTIKRLSNQLVENYEDISQLVFIGIQPRGVKVSDTMMVNIRSLYPENTLHYGMLDITFYRDDIRNELHHANKTDIPFSIEGKTVILIDDVLYTGRTIRAALDALQDFGRPQQVLLCVLVDRHFNRELPIQPDFSGIVIDTVVSQKVKVDWVKKEVVLY